MNSLFACCWVLVAVSAASAQSDFPLKKEDIHALIREIAPKIEERFKGVHPEADGLMQRMEETLALPPPSPRTEGDRPQRLARGMTLLTAKAGFECSITGPRGAVFDDDQAGHLQRYRDLEKATASDAAEVWRWIEMQHAAHKLGWKDQEEMCTQRACGAGRAWVSREPKNALAHTLLALALSWDADTGLEKLTALQNALKLDSKQPLALHELLSRRVEKLFEGAASRQPSALQEKSPRDANRALFDQPLTADEQIAFEKEQDSLRREAVQLLSLSRERGYLTAYLKTIDLLASFARQRMKVALAAARGPDDSFEDYMARVAVGTVNSIFDVFGDDIHLRDALELAHDDVESTGAILFMAVLGDAMHAVRDRRPLKPERQELFTRQLSALVEKARADESKGASRAAEAVHIIEMGLMMGVDRQPQHLDLLLRAVRLDPLRLRTQSMIMGMCIMNLDDLPAACAMTQLQLALAPSALTRRWCAAAAASVGDWAAAHRHLDACLEEKPDDVLLLSQKAVTFLRESQSRQAVKKAESVFKKILARTDSREALNKDDCATLTENIIRFHLIAGQNDAARSELAAAKQNKSLDTKECEELEKLLP